MQHLKTNQKHQYATRNLERRQRDTKEIKDQPAQQAEDDNQRKRQQQGFCCNAPFYFRRVISRQAKKYRRIGNGVHDGEETHEYRQELAYLFVQHKCYDLQSLESIDYKLN